MSVYFHADEEAAATAIAEPERLPESLVLGGSSPYAGVSSLGRRPDCRLLHGSSHSRIGGHS
jgi:hypothetical protein